MAPQEYLTTIVFLLLLLFWVGLISILICNGASRMGEGHPKSGIIYIICGILIIIFGIAGWYHLTSQPDWQFLKTPTCTECGDIVEYGDKFCDQCGQGIVVDVPTACAQCGEEKADGDKFCDQCGTQFPTED